MNDNLDQKIPYSTEAEKAFFYSIFMDNQRLEDVDFMKEEYFYSPAHGRIFTRMKEIYEKGGIAAPHTMANFADNDEELKKVGSIKYLAGLCVNYSTVRFGSHLQTGRYIRDLYHRRLIIRHFLEAKDDLSDEGIDLIETCSKIVSKCDYVIDQNKGMELLNGESVSQKIIEGMHTTLKPLSTGIELLDKAMDGGIYYGKMYGFAGKKKHGKTILGGTLSCNLACAGVKHLFICGEMSPQEVHQRNLARMGGFYPSAFNSGYSHSEDFKIKLAKSMEWQQKNILYKNAPGLTFAQLKHMINSCVNHYGIKGFILDYLQLVGGKETKMNQSEHMDIVSQWLADTCRRNRIFGIVLAQTNQEGNTRGGEGLRLAADQVYSIERPVLEEPGMWLQMMDTRYTAWMDVGKEDCTALSLNPMGPYFE